MKNEKKPSTCWYYVPAQPGDGNLGRFVKMSAERKIPEGWLHLITPKAIRKLNKLEKRATKFLKTLAHGLEQAKSGEVLEVDLQTELKR